MFLAYKRAVRRSVCVRSLLLTCFHTRALSYRAFVYLRFRMCVFWCLKSPPLLGCFRKRAWTYRAFPTSESHREKMSQVVEWIIKKQAQWCAQSQYIPLQGTKSLIPYASIREKGSFRALWCGALSAQKGRVSHTSPVKWGSCCKRLMWGDMCASLRKCACDIGLHTCTHMHTQHTATHHDKMQHTATHCNTLQDTKYTVSRCNKHSQQSAQEWRNRIVAEHACSKMGRAAARRNTPKQPRVIRAGPNEGAKLGPQYQGFTRLFHKPGGYQIFLTYLGFIGFSSKYQGFTGFFTQYRGFIFDKLCPISDFSKRKRWRRPSSNITKKQRKKKRIGDP